MEHKSLFIHAPNIRHGGGLLLLEQLLFSIGKKDIYLGGCFASNVELLNYNIPRDRKSVRLYSSNFFQYFLSNFHLMRSKRKHSVYLFFGNLPPIVKPKGFTILFLHSKLLLEPTSAYSLKFTQKMNLAFKKFLLKIFYKNTDIILVQTPSMARLSQILMPKKPVMTLPFYDQNVLIKKSQINYDFIYPSYGYIYKNHKELLQALIILAKKRIFPKIIFTLDSNIDQNLIYLINKYKTLHGLNLELHLDKPFSYVLDLFEQSNCLIWPSLTESLGIPLLDAINAKKDILAGDLEYINDLLNLPPNRKFDPYDPKSIARVIEIYLDERFTTQSSTSLRISVSSSDQFIERVMDFV